MRCRPLLILQRHKYRTLKPLLDKVGILTARIKQILTFRIIKIICPEKIKLRRTLVILQMPGKISRNQKRDNQYRNMEKIGFIGRFGQYQRHQQKIQQQTARQYLIKQRRLHNKGRKVYSPQQIHKRELLHHQHQHIKQQRSPKKQYPHPFGGFPHERKQNRRCNIIQIDNRTRRSCKSCQNPKKQIRQYNEQ